MARSRSESSRAPRTRRRKRRRSARRSPPPRSRLRSAGLPVQLIDLSDGGLAVESHTPLRIGASYPFTLETGPTPPVTLQCRVLWCLLARTEPGEDGDIHPVYRAGLERLPPEDEVD